MKALLGFVKTTLVGGLLFLVPLAVTLLVLQKAIGALSKLVKPIADEIPVETVAGIHMRQLLSALILVLVGFVAGLFARTRPARKLTQYLEQVVLRKLPAYRLLKDEAAAATGESRELQVALARFDDNTVLGFIVEPPVNGIVTVFVPSAPTPAAGAFYYLPEDRVQKVDATVADAAKVVRQLGAGSSQLLSKSPAGR
jgi:uncharacterized membrane protein